MSTFSSVSGCESRIAAPARQRRLFLRFHIGADLYAIDVHDIVQVLPLGRFKQVPGTPAWVAGIMRHGGQPVPVIDVSALATGRAAPALTSTRVALVPCPRIGDEAPALLGLILERATETTHYDMAGFVPSGLDNGGTPYLGPVLNTAEGLVQWVRVHELLPADARERLFGAAAAQDAEP